MEAQPVTVWKRWDDTAKQWKHNHIEDGHVPPEQQAPKPKGDFPLQRQWGKAGWLKTFGQLEDGALVAAP